MLRALQVAAMVRSEEFDPDQPTDEGVELATRSPLAIAVVTENPRVCLSLGRVGDGGNATGTYAWDINGSPHV